MFLQTRFAASIILAIVSVVLIAFVGCDDRNKEDILTDVYTHRATYTAESVLRHVYVDGNTAAVAASLAGAIVFDVTNLDAITEIYRYVPATEFARVERVVISETTNLLGVYMPFEARDTFWGQTPVWNYMHEDSFVTTMGLSGPLSDIFLEENLDTTPQRMTFWGSDLTDNDGLVGSQICRNTDTESWGAQCGFTPPPYFAPHGDIRGFGFKDNLAALANNLDGMHIEDVSINEGVADLTTPGFPYDCAWYGDYIVVADRYFVTIVDAAIIDAPEVVTNLIIDGADRLMSVEISGHYAAIMDEYDGVYIVDISAPTDPKLVQEIRLNEPTAIAIEGNRLFITDEQAGLLVYTR